MRKLLVCIVLIFSLTAVTSCFSTDTTAVVEAKEKKKKKSYALTWKGFKKRWKKEANYYKKTQKLDTIKNEAVKNTNMGPTKIGKIKENLYVGLNTNRDADGDFGFVSVSGRIVDDGSKKSEKNNRELKLAQSLAILTADPNLSQKKRVSIINDKLKLFTPFDVSEERVYSYKGITYKAKYDYKRSNYGTLTVSIIEE
ncbi:hypothetical protein BMG_6445 (plasmid) [Priestia megaterium]|uniref:hypothetical protein n=1 Tax=Priestia megaterium TaxID=1404 RepID=UPI0015DD42AA|nr:hypothetical protein [Priestia megaterium]QLK09669.1 hypothetical protein BMG_6445 [Priestia megaterium]